MAEPTTLDKTYHIIMKSLVETGKAPFFNEVAEALGVSMEEGRKAVQALFAEILPGWVFPKTDIIVSLAPFNNLPNQYPITVNSEQKWFGQ
jgi:hypothetical protein